MEEEKSENIWTFPRHRHFEREMRKIASDWFEGKQYHVRKKTKYILADREDWSRNIILPEVVDYIEAQKAGHESEGKGYPIHKYIHHGLSSQAMLFNLIGPLIVRDDLDPLQRSLEKIGLSWPEGPIDAAFEYENRGVFNENQGQPTSIDLVIGKMGNTPSLFLEFKFVEKEFGGCSLFGGGDCDGRNPYPDLDSCYLHHIGRRYWTLMEKHELLTGPLSEASLCIMVGYYQFFREFLTALELGGNFVLICDARSTTFAFEDREVERGLIPFLLSLVPGKLHHRFKILYIHEILDEIRVTNRHEWVYEFEMKYGYSNTG